MRRLAQRQKRELNEELRIANEELHANMVQLEESMDELEAGRRRAAFLADVSTELAASLDYEATLETVVWLAGPEAADWCFVALRGATTTRRVVVAHADPSSKPPAKELAPRAALAVDNARLYRKARTAEAELRRMAARLEEQAASLQAERARFEAVLRQLPAGVIVADAPSGRFLLSDAQAGEILGIPALAASGVEGRAELQGFRADRRPYGPEAWTLSRSIRTGEVVTDEEVEVLPEMKVLYMSGYTDKAIQPRQLFKSDTPFLNRPFTPAALVAKVREVLDTVTERPTGGGVS